MRSTLFEQLTSDTFVALPIVGWVIVGIAILLSQIILRDKKIATAVGLVGMLLLFSYSVWSFDASINQTLYFGAMSFDGLAQFFNLLAQFIVIGIFLMSMPGALDRDASHSGFYNQYPEFLMCLVFSGFGASVATSAVDLSSFFIGFETLSIGLYGLCGFYRTDIRSTESAFKYLLLGSFSTVILLFGLSFLYGASGSTNYSEIARVLPAADISLITLSVIFLVVGFGFKLALVPFHLYTPDVYEGAPTPVTAYLATIAKIAAVGAGIRIFWGILGQDPRAEAIWEPLWLALCLCSIIFGNLAALQQRSLKKLFAFSSISHAGFIGLGLFVAGPVLTGDGSLVNSARFPLLAYLGIYSVMSLGVFAIIHRLENRREVFMVEDLQGLGEKHFGLSAMLSIFVLGMAGIPPFAGFIIKFWVLQELVLQGHVVAAVIAVLGTLVGMAYYLRILKLMYMGQQGRALEWKVLEDRVFSVRTLAIVAVLITLVGGLWPTLYADWLFRTLGLK